MQKVDTKPNAGTVNRLQRFTTEYIESEDRVRLSGETEQGIVVIWLTQRLLQRLIPVLLQRLERETVNIPRAEALQSFAQQAARAELAPQAPVRASTDSRSWLASAVDIKQSPSLLNLTFKSAQQDQNDLIFTGKMLRHWLNILHLAYRKAGWPQTVWPEWMQESTTLVAPASRHLH